MAFQTPFGDASNRFWRQAFLPVGGLMIETGCITHTTDATFYVKTHMTSVYSVITNAEDVSENLIGVADVSYGDSSSGHIVCAMKAAITTGYMNYVAIGY